MRKYLSFVVAIVAIVILSVCFVACSKEDDSPKQSNYATLVIVSNDNPVEYKVDLKEGETLSIRELLTKAGVEYSITTEAEAENVVYIGELRSDIVNSKLITIFTSNKDDQSNSAQTKVENYKGTVLKSIGVKPSDITIPIGTIIYIAIIEY